MVLVPLALRQATRPHRVLERHWFIGRSQAFWILAGGFFEPFFYLVSTRLGFGSLVGDLSVGEATVGYTAFVAPALLASSAMNGALYETINVYFRLNHERTYVSMLATPITIGDVVLGDVLWSTIRGGLYAATFLAVMVGMGLVDSWWGLAALPASVLIAFSFGGLGMAMATFIRAPEDFEYVPTVMLPLFLFSASFFPASSYGPLAPLLNLSPLYHGVVLVRALVLGQLSWSLVGHILVLVALAAVSIVAAARRIERILVT